MTHLKYWHEKGTTPRIESESDSEIYTLEYFRNIISFLHNIFFNYYYITVLVFFFLNIKITYFSVIIGLSWQLYPYSL